MGYRVIDLDTFPRKKHLAFFSAMQSPYVGATVEVDATDFMAARRAAGLPFFLSFLYCVGRAANGVPALRQRLTDGRLIEMDACRFSYTVLLPDGTYGYCQADCGMPFDQYLPEAVRRHAEAKAHPSLADGEDMNGYIFISCLPWLHYASVQQPTPFPADTIPRIVWGKYEENDRGRITLPVTLLANHALVDGLHISQFFDGLNRKLAAFARERRPSV